MNAILALALKDLRLLARDRFGLFWVLGKKTKFSRVNLPAGTTASTVAKGK